MVDSIIRILVSSTQHVGEKQPFQILHPHFFAKILCFGCFPSFESGLSLPKSLVKLYILSNYFSYKHLYCKKHFEFVQLSLS